MSPRRRGENPHVVSSSVPSPASVAERRRSEREARENVRRPPSADAYTEHRRRQREAREGRS